MARTGPEWEAWAQQRFGTQPALAGFGATLAELEAGCVDWTEADAELVCNLQVVSVAVSPHADLAPHYHNILAFYAPEKVPVARVVPLLRARVDLEISAAFAPVLDQYWWDEEIIPPQTFSFRWWGHDRGFRAAPVFKRGESGRLLEYAEYRAVTAKRAETLGVTPRPALMTTKQYIAMKLEEDRVLLDGVAPYLYCVFESSWYAVHLDKTWVRVEEQTILVRIADLYARHFQGRVLTDTGARAVLGIYRNRHSVRHHAQFYDIAGWERQVPVRNGIIQFTAEWGVSGLRPISPRDFVTAVVPWDYVPGADCPQIRAIVDEILDHHDGKLPFWRDSVLGPIADGLIPGNLLEWFLWLFGPGGNGKGIIETLIESLFGTELVDHNTWEDLNPARGRTDFLPNAPGKLWNNCSENCGEKTRLDVVKRVTGGDTVQVRRLRHDPFDWKPTFKLAFFSNETPKIAATETALWRRAIVVDTVNSFEGAEDYSLKGGDSKLITPQEMSGFLNWLITYLPRRAEIKKQYQREINPRDIYDEYREGDSAIFGFLDDGIEHVDDEGKYVRLSDITTLCMAWYFARKHIYPNVTKGGKPERGMGRLLEYWISNRWQGRKIAPQKKRIGPGMAYNHLRLSDIFRAQLRSDLAQFLGNRPKDFEFVKAGLLLIPEDIRSRAEGSEDTYVQEWVTQLPIPPPIELFWDHAHEYRMPSPAKLREFTLDYQVRVVEKRIDKRGMILGDVKVMFNQWNSADYDGDFHEYFQAKSYYEIPLVELQAALDLLRLRGEIPPASDGEDPGENPGPAGTAPA